MIQQTDTRSDLEEAQRQLSLLADAYHAEQGYTPGWLNEAQQAVAERRDDGTEVTDDD